MFRFFRKEKAVVDPTEFRFQKMVDLVKDLSRADYNRLKKAMDLVYDGYDKMRNVKTDDEREMEEVDKLEKSLDKIAEKEGKEARK